MDVFLNYLSSLDVKPAGNIITSGDDIGTCLYNPTVDIRLSTLSYIAITRYNIPTDKLPKLLIRDDATIKGVKINNKCIAYYENIAAGCKHTSHMHAYRPVAYNDGIVNHISSGIIPPSVIYIETNVPVHLTSAVKYLILNHYLGDEFKIDVELEYLFIDVDTYAPITTNKSIKFLHLESIYEPQYVLSLLSFAEYVIFIPCFEYIPRGLRLSHIVDTPVKSILIPVERHNDRTASKKCIVNYTNNNTTPKTARSYNECRRRKY
jgi:hypothetical protein